MSSIDLQIDYAVNVIKSGGVVAFPTDTFFALGADALNEHAVDLLKRIKQRTTKPIPVLIPLNYDLSRIVESVPHHAQVLAEKFWPGPLTIILKSVSFPANLTCGQGTVGVRVPNHSVALDILSKVGSPVTGTSANVSGQLHTRLATEVKNAFKDIFVVDAPCGSYNQPSTVVDLSVTPLQIVRNGAIPNSLITNIV